MNPKADIQTLKARRETWRRLQAKHGIQRAGNVLVGIPLTVAKSDESELVCLVTDLDDRVLNSLKKYAGVAMKIVVYTWEKASVDLVVQEWVNVKADIDVRQLVRTLH